MSHAELYAYFIEVTALIAITVLCAVGFFRTQYKHMMFFFLSLGFISAVLLKAILP